MSTSNYTSNTTNMVNTTTAPSEVTLSLDPDRSSSNSNSNKEQERQRGKPRASNSDKADYDNELGLTNTTHEGELIAPEKFHRLGWKRLTICLIVEAIALGSLSIPSAFATLGMVAGVICTVGIGIVAIYTSYLVGQVKMKYPEVAHYADACGLMGKHIWGGSKFWYELTGVMFALFLILVTGSHTLTGTIAFVNIVDRDYVCVLAWGVVSAILLFLVALPPTFSEFAILGYIDFGSILIAIAITIIATGIQAGQSGGVAQSGWSAWPQDGVSFYEAFLAITNIVFAYSFSVCQYSFMDEMHTPKDYVKSIWALGLAEIFIYTFTGALVYAFVGPSVESPALLSAGQTISRIAFGVALPVIFISGSINTTVVGRYIIGRAFEHSPIRYINTPKGWTVWVGIVASVTVIAWIIAEAIPFFSALLGIISALFISGFTLYFPAMFWFVLLKDGHWWERKNIVMAGVNALVFLMGIAVLGLGTYASAMDIATQYQKGSVRSPFTCSSASYA